MQGIYGEYVLLLLGLLSFKYNDMSLLRWTTRVDSKLFSFF